MHTSGDLVIKAAGYLARHKVPVPRLEAEILFSHVLGQTRVQLYTDWYRPVSPAQVDAYRWLLRRRAAGEPTAYLTGEKEFMSLDFRVTPAVLIPRPETELLVEQVVDTVRRQGPKRSLLAETGTGSGAVAVSLSVFLPEAVVWATDISPEALRVAVFNKERHGLAKRLQLRQGDLLTPLPGSLKRKLHWVVANLPYIPRAECERLAPEVRHEPLLALDGGTDGLAVYRRLLKQLPFWLSPGGRLAIELGGAAQALALQAEMERLLGWKQITFHRDYHGEVRVLTARFG